MYPGVETTSPGMGGGGDHNNHNNNNNHHHDNSKVNDSVLSLEMDSQDVASIHSIALSQRTFPDNTGIISTGVSIANVPPTLHAYPSHLYPGGGGSGGGNHGPLWKGKKNEALRALDQGALDTIHVTKLGKWTSSK